MPRFLRDRVTCHPCGYRRYLHSSVHEFRRLPALGAAAVLALGLGCARPKTPPDDPRGPLGGGVPMAAAPANGTAEDDAAAHAAWTLEHR